METMDNTREFLDRCYSLAVLGGTFDPVHLGHLAVAEAVLEKYAPQRVLFLPCGVPPHKEHEITASRHRYHMVVAATCEHPSFDVTPMEINRTGVSYTIDTARALVKKCPPHAVIYFIVGADALEQLHTWKHADELIRLIRFITVPRPGIPLKQTKTTIAALNARYGERISLLEMKKINISSSTVRHAFAHGESVHTMLPCGVAEYARTHRLYTKAISFAAAKKILQKRLSPKRFTHTLGVMEEADKLARMYGADIEKTRWAALLHDCAKEYSTDKKHALCIKWNIPLADSAVSTVDLAHGLLGAESAMRDFNITDHDILQAIRHHSTGHGNMTLLDKIIMLADFTEPHREDYPPLAIMRKLAYTDMDKALRHGIKYTIKEETEANNPIHPDSFRALDALN
jgi:nicotinate-nucleotide adenylyltransferase